MSGTEMDKPATMKSGKTLLLTIILKNLLLYAIAPVLLLWFLVPFIRDAVRTADTAAFRILPAALAAVGLNWLIYAAIHRKRPPLPVFAHGILILLIIVIIQYEALPETSTLASTLGAVGGLLMLAFLLLLSFWFASCRSKAAHSAAVCIWVILGFIFCGMVYQVIRDIEGRCVTRDTWITLGSLILFLLALSVPRILAVFRRNVLRRRATGLTAGWIVQVIGET